jgi:hypothetical protein
MPFGLTVSAEIFQRCINLITHELIGKGVIAKIDDIIFATTILMSTLSVTQQLPGFLLKHNLR